MIDGIHSEVNFWLHIEFSTREDLGLARSSPQAPLLQFLSTPNNSQNTPNLPSPTLHSTHPLRSLGASYEFNSPSPPPSLLVLNPRTFRRLEHHQFIVPFGGRHLLSSIAVPYAHAMRVQTIMLPVKFTEL